MNSTIDFLLLLVALVLVGFYYLKGAKRIIDWIMKKLFED